VAVVYQLIVSDIIVVILLGLVTYLLFYCLNSYAVLIFEQPLSQEFPLGLIRFYLCLSHLIIGLRKLMFQDEMYVYV